MRSHARLFGHPIHQMLVPIPLGMFLVGATLDVVQRFVVTTWIPTVSYWDLTIGVVAGVAASAFGVVDLIAIPENTRAKRIGGLHAIGNIIVVSCFAISLIIRHDKIFAPAPTLALGFEIAALVLAPMTAWLGGELVDRLGVGVDEGANLDAPSSLSP